MFNIRVHFFDKLKKKKNIFHTIRLCKIRIPYNHNLIFFNLKSLIYIAKNRLGLYFMRPDLMLWLVSMCHPWNNSVAIALTKCQNYHNSSTHIGDPNKNGGTLKLGFQTNSKSIFMFTWKLELLFRCIFTL